MKRNLRYVLTHLIFLLKSNQYYASKSSTNGVTSDWFEDFVCRRLYQECGYKKEDVKKMSYYEMAKFAYNDLKENKLKAN